MNRFRNWGSKNGREEPGDLMNYIVNTEVDGQLSQTGVYQSSVAQLKRMAGSVIDFFKSKPGPHRLMFYCHGGLVSESMAGDAIKGRCATLLQNGVYPVFFMWQSSFLEALEDHLQHKVGTRFQEMSPVGSLIGEILEEAAKLFPEPWEAMKRRGEQVFASHGGGWKFFLLLAKALYKEKLHAEIHLVGHSAGAIVLLTLLKQLMEGQADVYPYLRIITCSLYAPACTVAQFENTYARAYKRLYLKRFFLYTLSDELERADRSVPYYGKSILYLISRGLEAQHGDQPIFGMQVYAKTSPSLQKIISDGRGAWVVAERESRPVLFLAGREVIELVSRSRDHGGFGFDPATLNSTLRTMVNSNRLAAEFKS